jgi:hypothetical protein
MNKTEARLAVAAGVRRGWISFALMDSAFRNGLLEELAQSERGKVRLCPLKQSTTPGQAALAGSGSASGDLPKSPEPDQCNGAGSGEKKL